MRDVARPLLAVGALILTFTTVRAHADPRGVGEPPPPATPESVEARRVQLAADMAAWLPRLTGRFRYEGVVEFPSDHSADHGASGDGDEAFISMPDPPPNLRTAKGLGDCVRVGNGPGVHCVVNVEWVEEWGPEGKAMPGGVSFLGPAVMLYGLDPQAAVMRYLLLDTDGLASGGEARLKNHTLTLIFRGSCESKPQEVCRQVTRIYAPPNGKYVQTSIDINEDTRINLYMRRVTDEVAAQVPAGL